MKSFAFKLILSFTLLYACYSISSAQVQKGDNNLGFSSAVSTESASPSNINATVLLVYERYLSNKLSIGVSPFVNMITRKGSLTGIFGGNVFANYGFITGDGKLYPYAGITLTVSQSISTDDTHSQIGTAGTTVLSGNSTVSFYGAGAKAGTKYFLTERINLDVNVNYSTNILSTVNGEGVDFGYGGVIQVFAGIGVLIGKPGS